MRNKRHETALAMPCIINPDDAKFDRFHKWSNGGIKTILVVDLTRPVERSPSGEEDAPPRPQWHVMGFVLKKRGGKLLEKLSKSQRRRLVKAMEDAMAGAGDSSTERREQGLRAMHIYRDLTDEELEALLPAITEQREERVTTEHKGFSIDAYPMGEHVRIRVYAPEKYLGCDDFAFEEGIDVKKAVARTILRIDAFIKRREAMGIREDAKKNGRARNAESTIEALKTLGSLGDASKEGEEK